jgi:TonB family protein
MKTLLFILLFTTVSFSQIDDEILGGPFYEIMPEIIGGLQSIQNRLVYPDSALKYGIEGKVYVLALIDSVGNVESARIIKGIGYGCDEEAIRLVLSAKFSPATRRVKKLPNDTNKEKTYSVIPYQCPLSISIRFKLS